MEKSYMTKKDFVSESLDYFLKEGINPKVHESPQAEIKKITKRLDHVFAFFKKQEQEFIRPLVLDFAPENFNSNRYRGQNNKKTLDNIEITNF